MALEKMPHIYDISTGNCYVESQKREGARPGEKNWTKDTFAMTIIIIAYANNKLVCIYHTYATEWIWPLTKLCRQDMNQILKSSLRIYNPKLALYHLYCNLS